MDLGHYKKNASRILLTCILVLVVTVIRYAALQYWDPSLSFILFYPVVVFCAWIGGLAIGILATSLSLISLVIFYNSYPGIELSESSLVLISLALEGTAISLIFEKMLRQVERTQKQKLRYMQTFISEAPAAIAMFDRSMRYLAVSKRWLSEFDLEDKDVQGRSHYDIFPELPERWKEIHQHCMAGAVERADEDFLVRSDGTKQWLSWEVRPWFVDEQKGQVGGILIFSDNITALKESHEQESDMRATVKVETALRVEAERVHRAKDEFVATLSHELRNPLNALLGWVQLLKRASSDPRRFAQALSAIERSGRVLAQLISDILDINRIAAGKMRLNVLSVQVVSIVEGALDSIKPEASLKNITLEKNLAVPDLSISGDPVRLQQCLCNLLSNAVKFTPSGGRITVTASLQGGELVISVSDTGQGIRPEVLPRIFDRFVQADASSTRQHGGLGLGLAIVRYLVELHGGKVAAESGGVGCGSTFTITLPTAPESTISASVLGSVRSPLCGTELAGLAVLVVDDELEARELLRGALEDLGAVVYTAASAESGLSVARSRMPHIIISDIAMPFQDGYTFIREIREAGIAVPAIALSAYTDEQHVQRARDAGFNQYLIKPVEIENLVSVMSELLSARPSISPDAAGTLESHL